jgi:hypothetical protein
LEYKFGREDQLLLYSGAFTGVMMNYSRRSEGHDEQMNKIRSDVVLLQRDVHEISYRTTSSGL